MGKFLVALQSLERWFMTQKRVLPWREDPSVYRVWVSEIMLQQTQVVTVVPFFERWMSRFPRVEDLAEAPVDEVLTYWAGLGYYSRARNLHRGSLMIVSQGRFPQTREEWLEIPGVGQYTAGAILSIASQQPEAILDGNVERVLSRVRRVSRQKGDAFYKERLWRLSRIFVETAYSVRISPSHLNQALMELGATLCTPKKPKCLSCPLISICRAHHLGETESYPPKKKPKEWIQVNEKVFALINCQGEVLLRANPPGEWRAGLWDFPSTATSELTSARQVLSEAKRVGQIETRYVVTRHKVKRETEVWSAPEASRLAWGVSERDLMPGEWRWVNLQQPQVPVGAPTKKILQKLEELRQQL